MKDPIYSIPVLVFGIVLSGFGQDARYVTVSAPTGTTNTLQIADFEAGELISVLASGGVSTIVQKDGVTLNATSFSNGHGALVQGPATFVFYPDPGSSVMATVKITPASFPPDKTVILPPGTNQVQVNLESSTNLVSWSIATNGIYGSPNNAMFFRVHMTRLN
jgi:hypothetical protein